jgi:hypothetical protein
MQHHTVYHAARLPEREEDLQAVIRVRLEMAGYVVLSTTVRKVRSGYGASPGIPDLLVTRHGWNAFIGLEVKTQRGRVREAQRRLVQLGAVCIVRSLEDALAAVQQFEKGESHGR